MDPDSIKFLVDAWAVVWTVLIVLGYIAEITPWPWLRLLRHEAVVKVMVFLSIVVVFFLTLAEARQASAVLAAWTIVTSAVKLLYDWLAQIG